MFKGNTKRFKFVKFREEKAKLKNFDHLVNLKHKKNIIDKTNVCAP